MKVGNYYYGKQMQPDGTCPKGQYSTSAPGYNGASPYNYLGTCLYIPYISRFFMKDNNIIYRSWPATRSLHPFLPSVFQSFYSHHLSPSLPLFFPYRHTGATMPVNISHTIILHNPYIGFTAFPYAKVTSSQSTPSHPLILPFTPAQSTLSLHTPSPSQSLPPTPSISLDVPSLRMGETEGSCSTEITRDCMVVLFISAIRLITSL